MATHNVALLFVAPVDTMVASVPMAFPVFIARFLGNLLHQRPNQVEGMEEKEEEARMFLQLY